MTEHEQARVLWDRGASVTEIARHVGRSESWVRANIDDGSREGQRWPNRARRDIRTCIGLVELGYSANLVARWGGWAVSTICVRSWDAGVSLARGGRHVQGQRPVGNGRGAPNPHRARGIEMLSRGASPKSVSIDLGVPIGTVYEWSRKVRMGVRA